MSRRFDRIVGQNHLYNAEIIFAFEYTSYYTFQEATRAGVKKILSLPSPDSKLYEEIRINEENFFPELKSKHDKYFATRFKERYDRRQSEIGLANIIIANSELTRSSHIQAGADPSKFIVLPLAAPTPVGRVLKAARFEQPLAVVWAGTFSVRKGAHYFLDAWRTLRAVPHAQASVYGAVTLPDRLLRALPEGLAMMGSLPQPNLFSAFDCADVLVFPTLLDGFGMVVAEAFSRGLPVITTDRAGAATLVEHGRNGLIVPAASTTALTAALEWCQDNRRDLYDMRFHAIETARRWQWSDYRRTLMDRISTRLDGMNRS